MSLDGVIERFRRADRPSVFVGAGVSYAYPTNIPLFRGLREAYLDVIDPGWGVLGKYAGSELRHVVDAIHRLPIERFFSDLILCLGEGALAPLEWMNTRPLNRAHFALRALAEELGISTVLTTNFDHLLERALPNSEAVRRMKGGTYALGYGSVPDDSLLDYFPSDKPAIFYLHGAVGGRRRDITPASTAASFDHYDHANLSPRLNGATLLVAGYGGADRFDIVPLLARCNLRGILWIRHAGGEPREERELPEDWRKYVCPAGTTLAGDTAEILDRLAGGAGAGAEDPVPGTFRDAVERSVGPRIFAANRAYLLSNYLNAAGHGELALAVLSDCAALAAAGLSDAMGLVTRRAVAISLSKSDDPEGRRRARAMLLDLERQIPELVSGDAAGTWEAREAGLVLESLAILHHEDGVIEEALIYVDKARALLVDEEDTFRLDLLETLLRQRRSSSTILGEEDAARVEALRASIGKSGEDASASAEFLVRATQRAADAGNLHLGIDLLELAAHHAPRDSEVYVHLSSLKRAVGDSHGALRATEEGLEIDPESYKLLCNRGLLLHEIGRPHEALEQLARARELNRDDPLTWNNLGNCYYDLGKLEPAVDAYIEAIALDPTFKEARDNLERAQDRLRTRSTLAAAARAERLARVITSNRREPAGRDRLTKEKPMKSSLTDRFFRDQHRFLAKTVLDADAVYRRHVSALGVSASPKGRFLAAVYALCHQIEPMMDMLSPPEAVSGICELVAGQMDVPVATTRLFDVEARALAERVLATLADHDALSSETFSGAPTKAHGRLLGAYLQILMCSPGGPMRGGQATWVRQANDGLAYWLALWLEIRKSLAQAEGG